MITAEIYSPTAGRSFLIDRGRINGRVGWTISEYSDEYGTWEVLSGLLQSKAEAKAEARRIARGQS